MAKSNKLVPGMGAFLLMLDYDGEWVAHMGANTEAPLRKERNRLPQWPDSKVKIIPNVKEPTGPSGAEIASRQISGVNPHATSWMWRLDG